MGLCHVRLELSIILDMGSVNLVVSNFILLSGSPPLDFLRLTNLRFFLKKKFTVKSISLTSAVNINFFLILN